MSGRQPHLVLHLELVEAVEPLVPDVLHVPHDVIELPTQTCLELLKLGGFGLCKLLNYLKLLFQ